MVKINLFFDEFENKDSPGHSIIRLKGGVQLKTKEGWSLPYSAIIDTGAHTSILPLSVWKEILFQPIRKYRMFGLSKNEACALLGTLATVNLILVDEEGNQSTEMEAVFFLAETDQVPILFGFNGLLDKLNVLFNFKENSGYVED